MALYAFDGTWNREYTEEEDLPRNTNVRRFLDLYDSPREKYLAGVGTRFGGVGRVVGGVFGVGGFRRMGSMYEVLCRNVAEGDSEIDVVGFSRGAALALAFVNRLSKKGICRPGTEDRIPQHPAVRFLGLWDVVSSFGAALNVGPLRFQDWDLGYEFDLPGDMEVRHCFHALALDERRETFTPKRVEGAYEVWFPGVHSDVGGGNGNRGLNDIAMRWMCFKALACGLPGFTESRILDQTKQAKPDAAPSEPQKYDLQKDPFRAVGAGDRVHYTVAASRPGLNTVPAGVTVETEADERSRIRP